MPAALGAALLFCMGTQAVFFPVVEPVSLNPKHSPTPESYQTTHRLTISKH